MIDRATPAAADLLPYRVTVVTSLEKVESLRRTWSAMQWHPNADLDFYSLIVAVRPEVVCPYVLVVSKGDEPVALLAGRLENGQLEIKAGYKVLWRPNVRRLTIIYGGWMGQTDPAVGELILRQLLRSLREEKADLLSWSGVRWGSPLHGLIRNVPNLLCRDYLARPSEHWRMELPSSLNEFLEQRMNKKHRYWAKRTMRMLEKDFPGTVRYACLSKPDEVDKLFADTIQVARKTYQWGLGVGFQDSEENRQRLRLAAERGWLRGHVLYLKEEPMAFWLCTVYGNTAHLDFTGYDPNFRKYEIGTALFLRMVGELAAAGVQSLDFGLGSASYKERFGDSSFGETMVSAFAFGGRGILLNALKVLTQGPAELIRSLLLRLRLEQKVKRLWRSHVTPAPQAKESPIANNSSKPEDHRSLLDR
jgi:hypothetical protein